MLAAKHDVELDSGPTPETPVVPVRDEGEVSREFLGEGFCIADASQGKPPPRLTPPKPKRMPRATTPDPEAGEETVRRLLGEKTANQLPPWLMEYLATARVRSVAGGVQFEHKPPLRFARHVNISEDAVTASKSMRPMEAARILTALVVAKGFESVYVEGPRAFREEAEKLLKEAGITVRNPLDAQNRGLAPPPTPAKPPIQQQPPASAKKEEKPDKREPADSPTGPRTGPDPSGMEIEI